MPYERPVTFKNGNHHLEGSLYLPDTTDHQLIPGVVICHPHPRAGGSMDNNVVFACCSGLRSNSIAYLRFNFQGVGKSQGIAGDPDSHINDVLSASDYLKNIAEIDPASVGIVGYSFGGSTSIKALLAGLAPTAIALIACSFPNLTSMDKRHLSMPKLIILGGDDTFIDPQTVSGVIDSLDGKTQTQIIPNADHFFMGKEPIIASKVGDFFLNELTNPKRVEGQANA